MLKQKILFIDRDGTLIDEPEDEQVDSLAKLELKEKVIPSLLSLQQLGYRLVMVSNQDGLGTASFAREDFELVQNKLLAIFISQGINFDDIKICGHLPEDNCECRKPRLGLVLDYLTSNSMDVRQSHVIGDRQTDLQLASAMGINGILYSDDYQWPEIVQFLSGQQRICEHNRNTKETKINVRVNLDEAEPIAINTGIGFFDHMLEQLAKHSGISISLQVEGDLEIDEHHTVEDTAIVLGEALHEAFGDKHGIARYGFVLPMDEAISHVAIDLGGRAYLQFDANLQREQIGGLPTELVPHFFHSLADGLKASLHIKTEGTNSHHMVESMFKSVGRALRQAKEKTDSSVPSTKGVL